MCECVCLEARGDDGQRLINDGGLLCLNGSEGNKSRFVKLKNVSRLVSAQHVD